MTIDPNSRVTAPQLELAYRAPFNAGREEVTYAERADPGSRRQRLSNRSFWILLFRGCLAIDLHTVDAASRYHSNWNHWTRKTQLLLTSHRARNADISAVARWTRPAVVLVAVVFSALTSAPAAATEDFHDLIRRQFEIYDPDYQVHRQQYGERLTALAKALAEAQANGRNLHCSQQMFLEAKWLYRYTAHWSRLEDKLKRIEKSLGDNDQSFATKQLSTDGF